MRKEALVDWAPFPFFTIHLSIEPLELFMLRSQCLVTTFAIGLFAVGSINLEADEPVEIDERFRKLIPTATAIDRNEFEAIARSPKAPTADSFAEYSLTAVLMLHRIDPVDGKPKPQFRYLSNGSPKPSALVREMYRPAGVGKIVLFVPPVTMIHSERITRCEAKVKGTTARGSFDFHVPDLYEGTADFVAKKGSGDEWQITEFQMATIGVHIIRDAEGKWQRVNSRKESKGTPD